MVSSACATVSRFFSQLRVLIQFNSLANSIMVSAMLGRRSQTTLLAQSAAASKRQQGNRDHTIQRQRPSDSCMSYDKIAYADSMRPHPWSLTDTRGKYYNYFRNMSAPTESFQWRLYQARHRRTRRTVAFSLGRMLKNWYEGTFVGCKLRLTRQRWEHASKCVWMRGNWIRSLTMESSSMDDAAKSLESPC